MTRLLLVLAALLLSSEAFRLWWLHPGPGHWESIPFPTLDVTSLENESGLTSLPLAGNVETGPLRFDAATYLRGSSSAGHPLAVLALSYLPNNANLWSDLFTHPPEVCMRSSGCSLETTYPARSLQVGDALIPVRILKYRDPSNGAPLFIFKAVWLPPSSPIQPGSTAADLRELWISMALSRIPHPPGAVLLAGMWGVEQDSLAWEMFLSQVGRHFRIAQS